MRRSSALSAAIKELHAQLKPKKVEVAPLPFDKTIYDSMKKNYGAKLQDAVNTEKHPKKESYQLVDALLTEITKAVPEEDEEKLTLTKRAFERLREEIFRRCAEGQAASGWPQVRPGSQDRVRSGLAAAHARFGAVYARRDAGAGYGDARHQG